MAIKGSGSRDHSYPPGKTRGIHVKSASFLFGPFRNSLSRDRLGTSGRSPLDTYKKRDCLQMAADRKFSFGHVTNISCNLGIQNSWRSRGIHVVCQVGKTLSGQGLIIMS